MPQPDLSQLARSGAEFSVRVTPKASRNAVTCDEAGSIRVYVTCVPEDGKANREVAKLLAGALGVARTRLELIRVPQPARRSSACGTSPCPSASAGTPLRAG